MKLLSENIKPKRQQDCLVLQSIESSYRKKSNFDFLSICFSSYFASNLSLRINLHKLYTLQSGSRPPPSTNPHFHTLELFGQNIIIIEKDYKISKLDRPRNCQPHTFFSDILLFADLQHSPGQPAAWAVAISEEKTSRGKTRWKKGKNAPRRFRIHSSCLFPFPNFLMYT